MSKSAKSSKGGSVKLTTPSDASRVQRAVAIKNGGVAPKGSEVGRLQNAAVRHFGKPGSK